MRSAQQLPASIIGLLSLLILSGSVATALEVSSTLAHPPTRFPHSLLEVLRALDRRQRTCRIGQVCGDTCATGACCSEELSLSCPQGLFCVNLPPTSPPSLESDAIGCCPTPNGCTKVRTCLSFNSEKCRSGSASESEACCPLDTPVCDFDGGSGFCRGLEPGGSLDDGSDDGGDGGDGGGAFTTSMSTEAGTSTQTAGLTTVTDEIPRPTSTVAASTSEPAETNTPAGNSTTTAVPTETTGPVPGEGGRLNVQSWEFLVVAVGFGILAMEWA